MSNRDTLDILPPSLPETPSQMAFEMHYQRFIALYGAGALESAYDEALLARDAAALSAELGDPDAECVADHYSDRVLPKLLSEMEAVA